MTTHSAAAVAIRTLASAALVSAGIPTTRQEHDNLNAVRVEATQTWARTTVLFAGTEQRTLGATPAERTDGIVVVSVFAPLQSGIAGLMAIADAVRQSMNRVTATPVTFTTSSIENRGRTGESTPWWQVNVSCPFYFE